MSGLRIAMFTDSFYPELGGIQDSVLASARALGERGHQVVIHAPRPAERDFRLAGLPVAEVQLGANVRVRRLFAVRVPSSTGQSRLVLPTFRRPGELLAFRPDVIHSHTFLGAGWEALAAARRLRVPIVGTNHWAVGEFGAYAPFAARFFAPTSVRAVTAYYNRCALVTAPSRSVVDEMRAFGLTRPDQVVSNPIDTHLFRPGATQGRAALKRQLGFSEATILYAGRLAIEKNIDVLIRALPEVARQVPGAMLALAGHGTAREALQQLAHRLAVADRVKFLGTLAPPALAQAYQAADVFAIASTSETQSMVLLQAMSSGLPAVGARWRALPEFIAADAGLLATPGRPEEFAAHLTTLLRDPARRARMGACAAQRAQRFAVARVVDTWEEIYARTARGLQPTPTCPLGAS